MLLSDAPQYNKDRCDLNIVHTSFGTNKTGSSQTVHRNGRGSVSVGGPGVGGALMLVPVGVQGAPLHVLPLPSHSISATLPLSAVTDALHLLPAR